MIKTGPRTYELDDLELEIYGLIKNHEFFTSESSKERTKALLRLSRNGLVENRGSRAIPNWTTSDNWKTFPYNYTSTIILPTGESNRDELLVEIDTKIAEAEAVVEALRTARASYLSAMEQAAIALRANGRWAGSERDKTGWRKHQ